MWSKNEPRNRFWRIDTESSKKVSHPNVYVKKNQEKKKEPCQKVPSERGLYN
jgi:hypothetical protein